MLVSSAKSFTKFTKAMPSEYSIKPVHPWTCLVHLSNMGKGCDCRWREGAVCTVLEKHLWPFSLHQTTHLAHPQSISYVGLQPRWASPEVLRGIAIYPSSLPSQMAHVRNRWISWISIEKHWAFCNQLLATSLPFKTFQCEHLSGLSLLNSSWGALRQHHVLLTFDIHHVYGSWQHCLFVFTVLNGVSCVYCALPHGYVYIWCMGVLHLSRLWPLELLSLGIACVIW